MAFDINDPETERRVRALAERLGVWPEQAIRLAVENELRRDAEEAFPDATGMTEAVMAPDPLRFHRETNGDPTSTVGDPPR